MNTRNRILKTPGARNGAAMVEFAVLMLVFVPLLFFSMYFQDALRYRLGQQEAAVSALWDFAYADYINHKVSELTACVNDENKKIYDNLESGNELAKPAQTGPWANFEWTENAIVCQTGDDAIMTAAYTQSRLQSEGGDANSSKFVNSVRDGGGGVKCNAYIGVTNHYIPKTFMQGFASNNVFDQGRNMIKYGDPSNAPFDYTLAVGPWCIHDPADHDHAAGSSTNPDFQDRVANLWQASGTTWDAFEGASDGFFSAANTIIRKSDDPTELDLRVIHYNGSPEPVDVQLWTDVGQRKNNTIPFLDGQSDMYKKAFDARGSHYLGAQTLKPNL